MKLEYIRLKEFKEKLHKIYLRDFPESERMPYYMIKKYYKNKKIKILALKDEKRNIVAYSMITEHNGYILLLYLAVLKDKRKNGYGSLLLNMLKEKLKNKNMIIIEIESLDSSLKLNEEEKIIRQKRRSFYIKNEYLSTNIDVLLYDCKMEILYTNLLNKTKDSNYIINEYLNIYYNLNDKIRKSGKIEVLNGK